MGEKEKRKDEYKWLENWSPKKQLIADWINGNWKSGWILTGKKRWFK